MLKLQLELIANGFFIYQNIDNQNLWGYFDPKFNRTFIYIDDHYSRFYSENILLNPSNWILYNPNSQLPLV